MGQSKWVLITTLVTLCTLASCQDKKVEQKKVDNPGTKLGLIASSLGVAPVPGYDQPSEQVPIISGGLQSHNEKYENGGLQGGIIGGNNDNYGGLQGGSIPLQAGSGEYGNGGLQGGNGGFQGGNGGFQGGNGGFPSGSGGFQGGNGDYGNGGSQGGNGPCLCVPIEQCASTGGGFQESNRPPPIGDLIGGGGTDSGLVPGYGPGESGGASTNPIKDGSGNIDIRIVNRPPGPGGVQCLAGQIFCCGNKNQNIGKGAGGGGNYFPGGGYNTCGKRSILNAPGYPEEYGQSKFGAYPWMAVILGKGNNYIGAGALLNSNYVLTAAHKVQAWKPGTYMKVRFGEWNAKDDDEPYKNVEIEVERIEIHPQFNPENLYNDVAVIKLARPIDINAYPHIKSVCLPQSGYGDYSGKRCWVAGFGKDAFGNGKHSYIMKEVDLPIVDSRSCENLLRGTRLGRYFELNKQSFLCAGGEEGKDACTGDGGSPLVCETNGVWNVAGLVAWGIGCADYAVPGVYVNVQNYLQWIESKIYY